VRVRVGVRVEGTSEAIDKVVVAGGLGLDVTLGVGDGVSVGVALTVAV